MSRIYGMRSGGDLYFSTLSWLRPVLLLMSLLALHIAAQDRVVANLGQEDQLPVLRQDDRPVADADLLPVLTMLNGQHSLDRVRPPGVTVVGVPNRMGATLQGRSLVVTVGVVLRTEAVMTPDRAGMATVLTVLPSAILQGAPPATLPFRSARSSRRGTRSPAPMLPAASGPLPLLRFVMAGGTVYFDDNNGVSVRQSEVSYPAPGTELVLGGMQIGTSAALLLQAACVLQQGVCQSIDGNPLTTDAITADLPGGLTSAIAFSLAGAPVASSGQTGVRGLGGFFESRYRLHAGDLRLVTDAVVPVQEPFLPAADDEMLLRGEVLQVDSALLSDGTGLVGRSLVSVTKILRSSASAPLRERTLEVVQRGGLLRRRDGSVLGALPENERLLVEGGDYFLSVGRTTDNRWEVRSAWRVVNGKVFVMEAPRTLVVSSNAYAGTLETFVSGLHIEK